MATLSITYTLTAGTQENVSHVQQNFSDISAWANGNIGKDNLTSAFLDELGLTSGGTVRKAYAAVATEQSTTSTSFTDLATPGPSVSVTVPSNGLVLLMVDVEGKYAVAGAPDVGLYEATDLATAQKIVACAGADGVYARGMSSQGNVVGAVWPTGTGTLVWPGMIALPATAGNRTYSLKYRNASGVTSTFKNRKLWVWAIGF